jgi:hypothetical protein
MCADPAQGARVGIDALLTFALEFEQPQVTLIKIIESIRFGLIHGIYLPWFDDARNWATLGVIPYFEVFYRRDSGFVQPALSAYSKIADAIFSRLKRDVGGVE